MPIRSRPRWHLPESAATPEAAFLDRRRLLAGLGLGAGLLALPRQSAAAAAPGTPEAVSALFPARRNDAYRLDRPLTPEDVNATYNNFFEFGSQKSVHATIGDFRPWPWTLTIDGLVDAPQTIALEDLLKVMPLEERLYRHRCVEAWSMTVPWTGFPLRALLERVRPSGDARHVRFETFLDPDMASGQRQSWYPWPYTEGLTMAEAANELAFLVVGAYGKSLDPVFGAPLRLAVPWKYGFKSIKSISRITFQAERPATFWETIDGGEYGFWANVNPEVDHPRWSQASERILHTGERVPTLLFNGYAEEVAGLYKDLAGEALYM